MELGVVSSVLVPSGFDGGLRLAQQLGLRRIEIACAGYERDRTFADPPRLNNDAELRARWLEAFASHDLQISALALHGQPLHPDRGLAERYLDEFKSACDLACRIGVRRLTLLAGLPEGAPGDSAACWIASAFPPENQQILEWQWQERVLPYWRDQAHYAREHGCVLCFEMHPGDVVFNPASLERLRDELGEVIACNYDPSHLLWQGIDAIAAIERLAGVIEHVHAKDTGLRAAQIRRDGILTAEPMDAIARRPWNFRTVGHGHGELFWRRFVAALKEIGYDDTISIEHEDNYMSLETGLRQATTLLAAIIE